MFCPHDKNVSAELTPAACEAELNTVQVAHWMEGTNQ